MKYLLLVAVLSSACFAVYCKLEGESEDGFLGDKTHDIPERNKRAWKWVKCKKDKDCKVGYYCSGSYCHPYRQCNLHVHCPDKWQCDFTEQVCKPEGKPECFKSRDCPNGQYCTEYTCRDWYCKQYRCIMGRFCFEGKCMYRECKKDEDCQDGQYCISAGLCRPRPTLSPTKPPVTEEPGSGLETDDL